MKFKYIIQYVFCLGILCCSGSFLMGSHGKYPIQNFNPADYKAGIQNIDFAQNRDMTIFVANNLGVLSFNGRKWKTYDYKTGKKKRSLAFDEKANRLYVGSQGDFGYFERDWQYVSLTGMIPANARDFDEVWDVFLLNSKVYFCTFQGIYEYDGRSVSVIGHQDGLGRSFLVEGELFTQDPDGRLLQKEGQQLVPAFPQDLAGQVIAGIIPEEEGYLLFYNSGEIEYTTAFGVSRKYHDLIEAIKGTYVNYVQQLSDTRLAVSTQTSGLFLYDSQTGSLEAVSTKDGLGSNACLRTFQDFSGNLWIGMQNGIARIDINSPMRLINREVNLPGSGYEAFETPAGTYYTTSNGIYFLAKNSRQSVFLSGTEGPAYGMQEIAGHLYASHHTGLFLLKGMQAKRVAETEGLWQVKQLRSRPEFAVGGTYSGLYLFRIGDDRQLKAIQKIRGFNASSRFFEEDQMGRIWVGQYYKGLFQLTLSSDLAHVTVNNISAKSDLPINEQVILSRVDDGLYLATNSGVYQIDPGKETVGKAGVFSTHIGEQQVYLFEQDRKNNVYLVAENTVGFFRQVSAGNYQFVPSSLYQLRYHLNNDLLHASVHAGHGILFSANEGFIHYDPEMENPFKVESPLMVSRVFSVTENRVLFRQEPFAERPQKIENLMISPRARVLQIDVESFQFNDFDEQHFRYFLKGFDESYGEWTTSKSKEYTNLREGNYEFLARTTNYWGVTETKSALNLVVKPPLHRSTLAKYLFAIGAILLILLVLGMQKRRFARKARSVEATKQIELARKQQELIEVEQLKERELMQLKEERVQSELRHLNSLLAASTMNLVVKNEFIETIKEELKELRQKGKNPATKRALEKIVKEIDTTLRLQEDWEQFEHHFDQVHRDFLTRLRIRYPDLSPNEQKLCTFLRLNLNTKEIANLLGISLRGVEVARYRLRKKLELKKGRNLSKFILEY